MEVARKERLKHEQEKLAATLKEVEEAKKVHKRVSGKGRMGGICRKEICRKERDLPPCTSASVFLSSSCRVVGMPYRAVQCTRQDRLWSDKMRPFRVYVKSSTRGSTWDL